MTRDTPVTRRELLDLVEKVVIAAAEAFIVEDGPEIHRQAYADLLVAVDSLGLPNGYESRSRLVDKSVSD